MTSAIINARIFDGERVLDDRSVVLKGTGISALGGPVPEGATVVDAAGGTLMPGLIDAHVHTDMDGLRDALLFGVTTELEMMGHWTPAERKDVAERDDVADVRSPGMGITPPGGHPTEYMPDSADERMQGFTFPFVSTPDEATARVAALVAEGADYIKMFIEDGTALGMRLPVLSNKTLLAAVREAHRYGKMAIAHATTADGTQQAIAAGVDGLAHVYIDAPAKADLIGVIAGSGAFVTPCLVLNSSAIGNSAAQLAADDRVRSKLSHEWLESLRGSINTYPQGNLNAVFATVLALHTAGVDILAGTDVSEPLPMLGGLAHGASLHHELQLLVTAGLTPIDALRAATATPARRFGLSDRGRIVVGARADLLLVDGDQTRTISDTLSIRAVWRRGVQLK
jgi:imidazolonepropionase-like amidohydrolase